MSLRWQLRWAFAFVGTVMLAAATIAVVFKGSGVGAVGIAGAGLLLLLIGVAGQLPTKLKVGDNEIEMLEYQLDEALKAPEAVLEAAVHVVTTEMADSTQDRDTDEHSAGSSAQVETRILQELESSSPVVAERLVETRRFDATVGEILDLLAKEHGWTVFRDTPVGPTRVDFLVTFGARKVAVEARTTRPSPEVTLGLGPISMFAGSHLQGVVFVVQQRMPQNLHNLMYPLSSNRLGTVHIETAKTPTVSLDPDEPKVGTRTLEKTLMRLLASK